MTTGDGFRMLIVCHANICRSPMVERLARQAFESRLGPAAKAVEISSAGTHARSDWAMHPNTEYVLREYGADVSDFASRRLTPDLVASADLVLAADREQRSACVTLVPSALRRTFTLKQFGRLAAAVPAHRLAAGSPHERLAALRDEALIVRSEVPFVPPAEDDLADPVREPIEAFAYCSQEISEVLRVIVDRIASE
ncbi:arsenate reductase/protein-tyrosine-phosphatase family protein [Planosporangium mesophilum]|nr:low molecular weight phosphatase family protein [Planosporangium mesophilum]NJC81135.1 low molecular weight phosphatase family protein [Planosporangium mesophilum]